MNADKLTEAEMYRARLETYQEMVDNYKSPVRALEQCYQDALHQLSEEKRRTVDKQAQDRYNRWHEAIEQLAKVEQLLAELEGWEAHEPSTPTAKAFNWTERLDKVLAELSHYRQELMKRVAQVAMKRLVKPGEGANGGG